MFSPQRNAWSRPRGARPPCAASDCATSSFQSTRPRGARPLYVASLLTHLDVSIHAPAWGATLRRRRPRPRRRVSIHAPAWGATDKLGIEWLPFIVSIHAPAWGATALERSAVDNNGCFNPRARVGRDSAVPVPGSISYSFQSTRPRGARPLKKIGDGIFAIVSIHAPAWGATNGGRREHNASDVSIHAPAWGATACASDSSGVTD